MTNSAYEQETENAKNKNHRNNFSTKLHKNLSNKSGTTNTTTTTMTKSATSFETGSSFHHNIGDAYSNSSEKNSNSPLNINNNITSGPNNMYNRMISYSPTSIHSSYSRQHSERQQSSYTNNTTTSSDLLLLNKKYVYIDITTILINGYVNNISREYRMNNIPTKINEILFNFYFEYQRHINQFAHDLWKTLVIID
eukprot:189527_1